MADSRAACCGAVLVTPTLTFRRIDPIADARQCYASYRDTCRLSFGDKARYSPRTDHLNWLRARVDEYPDGHVLAWLGDQFVGQIEAQVPYGFTIGYVNLFYVAPAFRGMGFGSALQKFVERYCRSWEANRIQLDVSVSNVCAIQFYQHSGYRFIPFDCKIPEQRRMEILI